MADVSRALVLDFVSYKLRQKGHAWPGLPNGSPSCQAEPVKRALQQAGDEFELRYRRAFSDLAAQLQLSAECAQQSFQQVVTELFRDGVNWGRIIAFFSFGGALSVESADKGMGALVPDIVGWMSAYFSQHLEPWVRDNGGWDAFVELYGNNAAAESRKRQETFSKWLLTGLSVAGILLLGSYLSRR
ncbi:bcl-2-like protein 1 [Rhinatrema bivittatum]|uniref:bcl-2-like protein 1 n=1 Tax=Rhinatrema bivittatum TaxID=194408 RepID=UPI0011279ADB|nr:bcl-2-like protein 1 [Rhinatrema bivittatum]